MIIKSINKINDSKNAIYLIKDLKELNSINLTKDEKKYAIKELEGEKSSAIINRIKYFIIIELLKQDKARYLELENSRKKAFYVNQFLNSKKEKSVSLINLSKDNELAYAYVEGFALSNYQFLKYYSDKDKRKYTLEELSIDKKTLDEKQILEISNISSSVAEAKTLVNEPLSFLTAEQLSKEIKRIAKGTGLNVTVFDKKKIIENKMGGLLAVNLGTPNPPTFNIIEWKPKKHSNKQPFILVGKGVVYDTGGLSLKPTKSSMDFMKSDMAGAAAVIGAMRAIATNNLPYHVIALIPATENRPDGLAYTPGDVIKMHNGMTVEVLNTDAEGRMILADALSYAKRYKPELVIDLATLTGAAAAAVGNQAVVTMGNADRKELESLANSGLDTFERTAEFPFWDDYAELLKSDVADMKNIGGPKAGAITAGKFLEKFTDYPYIHIDIAGSAFIDFQDYYRGKNATGVGVRLIYDFVKKRG